MTSEEGASVPRVPDDQLDYNDELVYFYQGERFTGVGYEEVGDLGLSEISYVDGYQHGPARDWYPSGQLKSEAFFRKNIRHGHSRTFREDGSLESGEIHEHGVRVRSYAVDPEGRETVTFKISKESPNYRILENLRRQFGE